MKKLQRNLLIFLLSLASIGVLAAGTYAAYTKSVYHKYVVAAQATVLDLRFSSNYLESYPVDSPNYADRLVSASGSNTVVIGLTVCNYPQNVIALVNENSITYTLTAQLENKDGNPVSVDNITLDNMDFPVKSISGTLAGGVASQNMHRISFSSEIIDQLSDVYIRILVTPDSSSAVATENRVLAGRLRILPAASQSTAWRGSFSDGITDFSQLDAFNYLISGTAEGTLTLTWSDDVTLSPWSVEQLLGAGKSLPEGTHSVTFPVGGADTPTSYLLQFYRTRGMTPQAPEISCSFK